MRWPATPPFRLRGRDRASPTPFAGELPCVYCRIGWWTAPRVTTEELMTWCREHIHERAAVPEHLKILDELPKTAVGKVFQARHCANRPSSGSYDGRAEGAAGARRLRVRASWEEGQEARALSPNLDRPGGDADEAAVRPALLGEFTRPLGLGRTGKAPPEPCPCRASAISRRGGCFWTRTRCWSGPPDPGRGADLAALVHPGWGFRAGRQRQHAGARP